MLYRNLGNSSLSISVIGLGGLHIGVFLNEEEATELINAAFEHGIQFIDTAPMYGSGKSESMIGRAIKGRRQQFVLGSKVGLSPIINEQGQFGVKTVPLNEKTILNSVEASLRSLQTDYIDLLQLHAYDVTIPIEETLGTLEKLKSSGKVRAVGCSNYCREEMALACDAIDGCNVSSFASLQTHYNILERRFETDLRPYCLRYNIGVLCYRALARGILNYKYKIGEMIPDSSRAAISTRVRQLLNNEILELVKRLNNFAVQRSATVGHLALAWLLSRPTVSSVVLGIRNKTQLLENICAVECRLSHTDIQEIDRIITEAGMLQKVLTDPPTFLET
ncbi:MAG TPA: aldo/keto reductase [Gammaproteobacteria bacterium]|nr:aldo/keto reductase [Gammaproteobacteria bacterium]